MPLTLERKIGQTISITPVQGDDRLEITLSSKDSDWAILAISKGIDKVREVFNKSDHRVYRTLDYPWGGVFSTVKVAIIWEPHKRVKISIDAPGNLKIDRKECI